jgi:hypothetical protein
MVLSSIERYERLLEAEWNEARRHSLHLLLAEACAEACLIMAQRSLEKGDRDILGDAARWRLRAEEYSALADTASSDGGREAFLRLAGNYEALADRAEGQAKSN